MTGIPVLKAARLRFTKENGCLILILTGLVVAEHFVEKEFQCICRKHVRRFFFISYLFIPAFIVFTVTFCIMCELERQRADKEAEKQELDETQKSDKETQNQKSDEKSEWKFILWCCIPSFFWVLLFFCDGRYVACIATTSKGEFADNTAPPPWEWCNKNRTLTTDEKNAEDAYIWSKIVGFSLLFLFSAIVLVYECRRKCKDSSEQVETDDGTAGKKSRPQTSTHKRIRKLFEDFKQIGKKSKNDESRELLPKARESSNLHMEIETAGSSSNSAQLSV